MRAQLENMLAAGQDGPLLRFTLGERLVADGEPAAAIEHLAAAVDQDPHYSAAWKLYGQALAAAERPGDAIEIFTTGIETAENRGDHQAAKEMRVFAKRARKQLAEPDT